MLCPAAARWRSRPRCPMKRTANHSASGRDSARPRPWAAAARRQVVGVPARAFGDDARPSGCRSPRRARAAPPWPGPRRSSMPPCGICHQAPGPSGSLGRIVAAADPDRPVAVQHHDADAGSIGEVVRSVHARRLPQNALGAAAAPKLSSQDRRATALLLLRLRLARPSASGASAFFLPAAAARRAASSARTAAACPSRPPSARSWRSPSLPCRPCLALEVAAQAASLGDRSGCLRLQLRRQLLLDQRRRDRCPWPGSSGPTACSSAPWSGGWRRWRPSGMMVCTEPLPNERVPITVARLWSCSAPATISDADAEPPLISTTIGLPSVMSPGRALARCVSSRPRPLVSTIAPFSRKSSETAIAWSSRPPGLPRRSMT